MMPLGTPQQVFALRQQLWDAGFRPVAIYSPDASHAAAGKAPRGADWGDKARQDPPAGAVMTPTSDALNTGILCDGLRAIDIDIDNPTIAHSVRAKALAMFGETAMRYRANSPRALLVYRAAEGAPPKRAISGTFGKVEVLGRGQQFVGFGVHPSGADLQWMPEAPGDIEVESLRAVTEAEVTAFLEACAPTIGADAKQAQHRERSEPRTDRKLGADALQVVAALCAIPNNGPADWEAWNRIGMATWAATSGNESGRAAFHAWSQQHASYDADATNARWDHYAESPPTQIGAGTLFYLARQSPSQADDVEPEGLWDGFEPAPDAEAAPEPKEALTTFPATSLRTRNLSAIPPRQWVYGRELVRGFVSVLGSPGGTGKTAYVIAVALSVATGRPLLATGKDVFKEVHKAGPVWIYNLEDPADEMDRRLAAAINHYALDFEQVADGVYVDSGRSRPLIITTRGQDGTIYRAPVIEPLVHELKARGIVVLVIDPFVQSHTAEENRNDEMNTVMAAWGQVANDAGCAVWLVHHFRKGGQSGDAESFRGAAAIQGAARVMSTLATMSAEEASKIGVDEKDKWQYIRRDNAKANMAPRSADAEWYRLASVALNNGTPDYPQGDHVQVAETWAPPSPWDGIPWALIVRMLDKIEAGPEPGEFYAAAKQANHWCGSVVMDLAKRQEGHAATIIKAWMDSGVLVKGTYSSPARKNAQSACVRVDQAKVAEMRRAVYGDSDDGE